jgi:hypothetical protein
VVLLGLAGVLNRKKEVKSEREYVPMRAVVAA